jgi:DNA-binding CsgD family transcriptional regulator
MSPEAPNSLSSQVVGRSRERIFLHEALVHARAGRGQVVLVGGEAGIGKTTLIRDLLLNAEGDAYLCMVSQCYDLSATPPYGLWLDLFAGVPLNRDGSLVPSAFEGGYLGTITDQAKLYAEVRDYLIDAAAETPVLIILEDLHWADPASLELLRYLAPRLGSSPVLLLLTYRDDEITRSNPFYQQLPQLLRESGGLRLDLRPLTAGEMRDLVRRRWQLPIQQEESLVRYLSEHAEGNPFFATELLRGLEAEEIIQSWADDDTSYEIDRLVMPPLLQYVIDQRVDKLGVIARERLAIASVIGQEVPITLWAQVSDLEERRLLETIEPAVEAHLLEASRSGTRVMFVHALTRAALYEGIFPPKRRDIHRQVADALMESGSQNLDSIAYHLVQAGDSRAPDWLIKAGEAAQRSYAWLSAGDRFQQAADLLQAHGHSENTRGWLLYRFGRLQRYRTGRNAFEALAEARRIGQRTGDPMLETDAQYSLGVLQLFSGDFGQGIQNMRGGIELMETQLDATMIVHDARIPWMADSLPSIHNPSLLASDGGIEELRKRGIHHRRGGLPWFLANAGRFHEAESIAQQFLEATEHSGAPGNWVISAEGHCRLGAALVRAYVGDTTGAREHFEAGRTLYASLDHHAVMAFSMLSELHESAIPFATRDVHYRRMLGEEAREALRRAAGSFPEGLSSERAMLSVHFLDGNWKLARTIADDIPNHGTALLRREVVLVIGAIARAQGRFDEAWSMVQMALPFERGTVPGTTLFPESIETMLIAADVAIDQGDLATARAWLETYDLWIDWSGTALRSADGQVRWARVLLAEGDHERAADVLRVAIESAQHPEMPLVLIAANRLLGEIAAEDGRWADAHALLEESLHMATACHLPYEQALTRASLVLLLIEMGELEAAQQHYELTTPVIETLELAPLRQRLAKAPSRLSVSQHAPADGLTPRELEVLKLVALGMTDAAIGEALFISPRTASQHLRSIYAKLGVPSRAAATRYAVEHGLS